MEVVQAEMGFSKGVSGHGTPREALLKKRIDSVPAMRRGIYEKAVRGEASPRQAIKAKCQECCGWEDVVNRVGDCTSYGCPLWLYRPHQDKSESDQ